MARNKKKSKDPQRTMRLNFNNGSYKDLEIAFGVSMKSKGENDSRIYLEQLDDGRYRLVWSENLMKEFSSLDNMQMIRTDGE